MRNIGFYTRILSVFAAVSGLFLCSYSATAQSADSIAVKYENGTKWVDAGTLPLYGKAVSETAVRYGRLPLSCKEVSRPDVWSIGQNSTGLYVRFRSNATSIQARWTSTNKCEMNHMATTGSRGLDLYALEGEDWFYVGAGRPNPSSKTTTATMISGMDPEAREYMLYLSLYDGVEDLWIGVDSTAFVSAPEVDSPASDSPIVFYGTSVTQGGCASRPGMGYTSIISRHLLRECINLGFSGNGRLDLEIAELMAAVENPYAYVLDYAGNAFVEDMLDRDRKFYDILRAAHPTTPIIITGARYHIRTRYDRNAYRAVQKKEERMNEFWNELVATGDENIWFVPSEEMMDNSAENSVDGIHLTDLGMEELAELIETYLLEI